MRERHQSAETPVASGLLCASCVSGVGYMSSDSYVDNVLLLPVETKVLNCLTYLFCSSVVIMGKPGSFVVLFFCLETSVLCFVN